MMTCWSQLSASCPGTCTTATIAMAMDELLESMNSHYQFSQDRVLSEYCYQRALITSMCVRERGPARKSLLLSHRYTRVAVYMYTGAHNYVHKVFRLVLLPIKNVVVNSFCCAVM